MGLPEVDVFFKKNKRRRGLLICISIAILWFFTITATITPWISCPEDSASDFIPSNNDEKILVSYPNEKPNTSKKINEFTKLRYTRDVSSAWHQRQLNTTYFESSVVNHPVNTKLSTRDANRGYILRIRKYNARKRRERYRRNLEGSGDITGSTSEALEITPTSSYDSTSSALDYNVTNTIDEANTDNVNETSLTNITNSFKEDENATNTTPPSIKPTTKPRRNRTRTTATTITTTTPSTTTKDPCENGDPVSLNVRFPKNNVLAYQINVRFTRLKKKATRYNATVYHNRDMVANTNRSTDNVSVSVFTITDLKPCRHYNVCVVALFEDCPDTNWSCNVTTTATNITNVEITNLTARTEAKTATISFDRPETDCKVNFTIKVNYTFWEFNAEDNFTLISSYATNDASVRWISDSSSDRLAFEVMDLSVYTSYFIEVSATSASSKSLKANMTIKTKPSVPTQVKNASCILNNASVIWEPPENFNGEFEHYRLEIKVCLKNGTNCERDHNNTTSDNIYNISSPEPGKLYKFKIQAKTKDVEEYGKELQINCSTPTVGAATSEDKTILIVVGIFTCILLIVLLVVIALKRKNIIKLPMVHYKWRRSGQSSRDTRSVTIPFRVTSKPVQLVDLEEHYRTMTADSSFKFSQEFEELVSGSPSCPTTAALMSENRVKNRWVNILPFDHSRVKLLPIADDIFTDYINASYIPGYKSQREFIASQGPLSNTKDDFWRMVWEQNSPMIVMVTQCIERGKEKCEKYWPGDNETHYYGDLAVKLKSESILTGYTLRIFDLHLKMPMTTSPTEIDLSDLLELIPRSPEIEKGSRAMEVKQMHFTMWPDFGCPENTSLLINFVGSVRDHMPHESSGPIIVHCSAGVGRTGTFIAVDKLIQHVEDHDFVDIFGTVREMRNYRTNMVQTEDQYMYIHECVKDLLIDMQTRTPIDKNSGESMIDIIGMAQAETPSRNRRTETSGCDLSETEMTETTVLLSVTTGASDLTDTVFSELTDTTSVLSDHAFTEPEPHGDADKFDQKCVLESPQFRLSSTNSMLHDPNDTFLRAAVGEESPCLQPTEKTQSDDSADIPLSSLAKAHLNRKSDIWYF